MYLSLRLLKQVLSFALDLFLIKAKVLGKNLFSIANNCFVNLSDRSKMLVKKQMKYFDQCHLFVHNLHICFSFVKLHIQNI